MAKEAMSKLLVFDQEMIEEKNYWLERLSRGVESSNLILDYQRPAGYCRQTETLELELPEELCRSLNKITGDGLFLLYTTLMTALKVCLYKYTGSKSIAVGSPSRRQNDNSSQAGNALVIVDEVDSKLSFRQLLLNVRQTLLDAYARQRYPFERLIADLELTQVNNKCPLFDVALVLKNIQHDMPEVNNDITITIARDGDRISASLAFSKLFTRDTIDRFAGHFVNILRQGLHSTAATLSELDILTQAERRRLLIDWNKTRADYPRHSCIQELFEAQVERTPGAIAVESSREQLTYGELNRRANQLAHHLRKLDTGPGALVGLCMNHSPESLVAILGIIKAGAGYLPLDPAYPKERLAFMLHDAQVKVLLTNKGIIDDGSYQDLDVIDLDTDWEMISRESEESPILQSRATDIAYAIYTSGSTGKPKGVEIQHSSLLNLVTWHQREYDLTPEDRTTLIAAPAFDASVWELWPYLASGASIHIPDAETRSSAPRLLAWLADKAITISFMPTPLAEAVLQEALPGNLVLRALLTGGDKLHRYPQQALPFRLINHYGPTENTVVATCAEVASGMQNPAAPPIGRPISNTEIYLLDADLRPVPVGVSAELCVAGDGLGRGYLNRPELTAEKFIPNPFGEAAGARLYKTGDLARYLADGSIEFIGRIDHQVKLHGFRIELGEIEAVLCQHHAINEAVVAAREDVADNKRLVAYIAADRKQSPTLNELRSFMKEKLPDYMIPSAIVVLDTLPLTPNGKVDRRALPVPGSDELDRATYAAPRTPIEQLLAGIWSEVLGIEQVGIHDNLFDLGGHSLLATRIISRLRETFNVELPLVTIFESPTVAGLSKQIEQARLNKQGLNAPPIVPVERGGVLPLSFAQERLWILDQLEPDNPFYNVPAAVRLSGSIDLSALEQSFNEIIRRHEALRTRVETLKGKPVQVIASTLKLTIPVVDLSRLPEDQQEAEAIRVTAEDARMPFNLRTGPLLRTTLLRLNEEVHVMLLTMHHIVSDGWSLGLFVQELAAFYESYSTGTAIDAKAPDVQPADFAVWQREWLQGEVLEAQLEYWKQQLGGNTSVLRLPTDRPRPAVQTFRGTYRSFSIPGTLSNELKTLSSREGATLFMTLLAAFKTLLYRYTAQEDIVVGTPIANRNRGEIERLIGFFVNTLVLRTDLSGNVSFRELLGRVREVSLGAYTHQDLPFEQLVEALQPQRDLSHTPLFQVAFALQNAPMPPLELSRLTLNLVEVESRTSKFDLTLSLIEEPEGLRGAFEYNTDLFDQATIDQMAARFRVLLESIVANPDHVISTLPLLSQTELHRFRLESNDPATEYPKHKCIHELFEAQEARTPNAVAAIFDNQELTYGELNGRANQLANYLRTAGVGPDALVAICMERSIDMVVGILGILKAGGAYVPLEPSYPKERLAFMIEDAQARVLLTQQQFVSSLPEGRARVICLDADSDAISRKSDQNLPNLADAENLAYVVYTSGSTGTPKGVGVSHRAVNRLVFNTNYIKLDATDRVAQASTASFDAATFEIWGALLQGAALVGIAKDVALSPRKFAEQLSEQGITTMFLTTALFNQLAGQAGNAFSSLRNLLFGGEAVDPKWVREVLKSGPPERLLHVYGPTESTTFTSWHLIHNVADGATTIPIGRPISNTQIYLLDADLQPVPVGVPAELYIGGDGLGRGYLNRPELTAEKFIPNPFNAEAGGRLYRTGDQARYLADYSVEFIGRIDHQVKIRGFRIELGEIEAVLSQHPGIRENAVAVCDEESGEKRLVAYLAFDPQQPVSIGELRGYLKERLPDYMIPSAWVMLDALPLTQNGKVDRRALPAPEKARPDTEGSYVAPRNAIEETLAEIFAEILGLEQAGVYDNFFEMGGHSLLATQTIARLRDAFKIEVPLRSLFESPTVAGLSKSVQKILRSGDGPALPAIERAPRNEQLLLSFGQQRLWFLDQLEPNGFVYNIPLALRLRGRLDVPVLERSLNEIVRRHEVLRTTFTSEAGQPSQNIVPELTLPMPVTDLCAFSEAERESRVLHLARSEAEEPFDLAGGPLLRARLLQLGDEDYVLLFTMHHIVSDGWSMGVLVQEVAALYEAFHQGRPSPLLELPIQYADYAQWQRHWLRGEALEAQIGYWRQQLGGSPPVLELPTDKPRPAIQTFNAEAQFFSLPGNLNHALKSLSRQEGVTLFMVLLAALKTLLYRYSGQEDISIGSPIANRRRAEMEGLIGFFVNTLVMRTGLSGDPSFRELLGRVNDAALGAYAHQDLPFEKLVEELQPERDLGRTPFFQVMFALQNAPMDRLTLPGLTLTSMETDSGTTKFDLTLLMNETEEGLVGLLRYNTDLFEAATINRMSKHFQTLLESIVANPEQRLSELTMLTDAELYKTVVEWNNTRSEFPGDLCIHQLFEAQAARTPDATALVFENRCWTYDELNRQANRLAHHLQELQAGPEVLVGIWTEYPEMIVALLGIHKAGGAYIGLDPALPKERLAFMLEDAGVSLIVTQEHMAPSLPENNARLVCLDTVLAGSANSDESNPTSAATGANLAYVIYTSGSTGRPKGVAGEHRQILSYLNGILEPLDVAPGASFAMHQTLAVDAPITFLFASLCTGGVLHLLPREMASDSDAVGDYFERHQIDYFKVAPSHLAALQASSHPERVLPRRLLLVGGEASHWDSVERIHQAAPDCAFVNHYGPTETTVGVLTYHAGKRSISHHSPVVPLGYPIANAEIYLLDAHLNPAPIGIPGELHIGGTNLSRGYLDRPELTAQRFIPNPFSKDPGGRLYKTGDLARYLADGCVEFIARTDHQVKIRGFRIELGEIEAVLAEHPSVQSTVIVCEDTPADKRLVAYATLNEGQSLTISDVRGFLKQKLPDHMVPSALVVLEAFPRTPQGKVDRKALPAPDHIRPELDKQYIAPRTALEDLLAGVWAEVLGLELVGIQDNFFDLGGHSLLATQVVARLREALSMDLPVRSIFESPTIAELSWVVEQSQAARTNLDVSRIERIPRGDHDLDHLLAELDELSDAEVEALLTAELQLNQSTGFNE